MRVVPRCRGEAEHGGSGRAAPEGASDPRFSSGKGDAVTCAVPGVGRGWGRRRIRPLALEPGLFASCRAPRSVRFRPWELPRAFLFLTRKGALGQPRAGKVESGSSPKSRLDSAAAEKCVLGVSRAPRQGGSVSPVQPPLLPVLSPLGQGRGSSCWCLCV